jgi:hypothetical protein
MGTRYGYPKFQAFKSNGDPLSGGKLYTYTPGTTTNKTTYSDKALTSANTNPVVLDSNGEATVYGTGEYKFVLKDSDDVTLWTVDNISGIGTHSYDNAYYVDSTVADQGVVTTSGDRSVKDHVDAIGTSEQATLVFSRGSSGDTTTYTFSTDETIPSNITVKIETGAILSVDSGVTLTINGPLKLDCIKCLVGMGVLVLVLVQL